MGGMSKKEKADLSRKKKEDLRLDGKAIFPPIFGYELTDVHDQPVRINKDEAEIVKQIFYAYYDGNTIVNIIEGIKLHKVYDPNKDNFYNKKIYRIINNPIYIGKYLIKKNLSLSKKNLIDAKHYPGIIHPDLFWNCQDRQRESLTKRARYTVSSVITCACKEKYYYNPTRDVYAHNYNKDKHCDFIQNLNAKHMDILFENLFYFGFLFTKENEKPLFQGLKPSIEFYDEKPTLEQVIQEQFNLYLKDKNNFTIRRELLNNILTATIRISNDKMYDYMIDVEYKEQDTQIWVYLNKYNYVSTQQEYKMTINHNMNEYQSFVFIPYPNEGENDIKPLKNNEFDSYFHGRIQSLMELKKKAEDTI